MTFDERVELLRTHLNEMRPGADFTPIEADVLLYSAFPDLYGEKPTHKITEIDPALHGDRVIVHWRG